MEQASAIARTRPRQRPRHRWHRLGRARAWFDRHPVLRWVRKIGVSVIGSVLIIAGLLTGPFLPGPQGVLVVIGFVMLGSEFIWAHRAMRRSQMAVHRTSLRFRGRRAKLMWRIKKRLKRYAGLTPADTPAS